MLSRNTLSIVAWPGSVLYAGFLSWRTILSAIIARSAELNAWKELTEPVDDEPDEQNDETKEKEAATV